MKTTIILICFISVGLAQPQNLRQLFKLMDFNGDRQLSVSEYEKIYDYNQSNYYAASRKGHLTLEEFIQGGSNRTKSTLVFNFYDMNHDGDFSRDADLKLFVKSKDSNNDGTLSVDEFLAYAKKLLAL